MPDFREDEIWKTTQESLDPLDSLGRCGTANSCIGIDGMPDHERGNISEVHPTGWHKDSYTFIEGRSLYNRCHLIAYSLSGDEAIDQNLITGTSYMNRNGMNPFEISIAEYVKDTGIGMDAEFLPKIFDTFTQEDDQLSTKYGSTGLGMAITKRIVEMMNGSISVESEKGIGTEFAVTVTLKNSSQIGMIEDSTIDAGALYVLVVDDDIIAAEHAKMVLEEVGIRADMAGRKVLLAEDMEINSEIIMDLLEMEGIEADHAENGKIVFEMFEDSEEGTYAAVLMDVRMPEMDGLEATAAIRALDREDAKSVPIIALTANAFDEDVQRSMQAGMNAHLTKPVEADHLIQVMSELVYETEAARG